MENINEYITSGVIEAYVLGLATQSEVAEVEELAAKNAEVRKAIDEFSLSLEQHAVESAVAPDPLLKPLVIATLNYVDRLEKGEPLSSPPTLNAGSKVEDYKQWLEREDMRLTTSFHDVFVRIISATPEITTAIVWLKDLAPVEVHHKEVERFLIVEGSCEILIENEVHNLTPGSFLSIPLYKQHSVRVTSDIPCKAIVQRIAA